MEPQLLLIGTIATVVQTIAVIAAIFISLPQLKEAGRARELQSLQDVFSGMHTEDADAQRDQVLVLPVDSSDWSDAEWRLARREGERMQRIGFYVRHGFLRAALVLEMYSLLIINLWRRIGPFVRRERERMSTPRYFRDFEYLNDLAVAYRLKHGLKIEGEVGETDRTPRIVSS
jgi:hypothetical protein